MVNLRFSDVPGNDERWYKAVKSAYNLNYLELKTPSGLIRLTESRTLTFTKYLSSAPFLTDGSGINQPLTDLDIEMIRSAVINCGAKYAVIKSRFAPNNKKESVFLERTYVTMVLDLSAGEKFIFENQIEGKTRNQLRKAQKGNFLVKIGREELQEDAFKVLTKSWRDLGTPAHASGLLSEILTAFSPDSCWLTVIYSDEKPVSSALVFKIKNVLHHPWAATINEFKSTSVNNLLYWSLIQQACKQNCSIFDMGRCTPNLGTYVFKQSWGAVEAPLFYTYIGAGSDFVKSESSIPQKLTKVWRYVPLAFANAIGPYLIKTVL